MKIGFTFSGRVVGLLMLPYACINSKCVRPIRADLRPGSPPGGDAERVAGLIAVVLAIILVAGVRMP
jgi:hypothetical protein